MSTVRLALIELVVVAAYLGLTILGSGGFAPFFSHRPLDALVARERRAHGGGVLHPGKCQPRRARGPLQPLGHRGFRRDRPAFRLLSGLCRPQGFLDHRRRGRALARRRALRGRRRAEDVAGVRARPTGSAGSSRSSRGTRSSPAASTASSAIRAISASSSTRSDGASRFIPGSACGSRRSTCRRSSRASAPRSGCSARSSAPNTMPTARGPRAFFRAFTDRRRASRRPSPTYRPCRC